jgi:hypothetical protein
MAAKFKSKTHTKFFDFLAPFWARLAAKFEKSKDMT